jgi:hypothetical protein
MGLFMFIFTLLGMELFAYRVKYNNEDKELPVHDDREDVFYPRASFNNFFLGFTTVFIVFIGEDWNSVMYDHTRAQGYACVAFFMFVFIVGNLIMLNLFLAILLKNFEEPPGKEEEPEVVEDTGPGFFTVLKGEIASKLSICCTCFGKEKENATSEENPDAVTAKPDNEI